jgi:hypothetical protein
MKSILCYSIIGFHLLGTMLVAQQSTEKSAVTVPSPLTVGIDDLGWKQGWSSDVAMDPLKPHHIDGPENRWMGLEDYKTIVDIASRVNSRLLCLFIMSEFDRENICADFPCTTEQGEHWDNSALVSDNNFIIMDYIKSNAAFIEFGLHGVRHNHWKEGNKMGEFAMDNFNRNPHPVSEMQEHLHCFEKLIEQYGISFPKSFVPPRHCYYHNPADSMDTGGILAEWGIKYVSWGHKFWGRNYDQNALNPMNNCMLNHGVLVLERDQAVTWRNSLGIAPDSISTDFYYECTHWHNYIAADPKDNHIIADKWIKWFNQIKDAPDRYLPKNTAQLYSQALYLEYSKITIDGNVVSIDNTEMPDWAYHLGFIGNLEIKCSLDEGEHVSKVLVSKDVEMAYYCEDGKYAYVSLPVLEKDKYDIEIQTGNTAMSECVINNGTYCINGFNKSEERVKLDLTMYGKQLIQVKLDEAKVANVRSDSEGLIIDAWKWNEATQICSITIASNDTQGVAGSIQLYLSD